LAINYSYKEGNQLSTNSYQWITPVGSPSKSYTLNEVIAQIEQGRAFPPRYIQVNHAEPEPAYRLHELQESWQKVSPLESSFEGASGRAKPLLLARLFAQLSLDRSTGYLYIRQSDANLYFTFRFVEGQLVEVSAHDPSTYLGQLFVQQNVLTPEELNQVIKWSQHEQEPIGKICIDHNMIDSKTLNRALAEQIFTRMRRIACFPKCDILFRPDRRARMSPPVARVSCYSLLEICLGYGLNDHEIKSYVSDLLSHPIHVHRSAKGLQLISAEDRLMLKKLEMSGDLSILTQHSNWTHRDAALKAIAWDLVQILSTPPSYVLAKEYEELSKQGVKYLGLSDLATLEAIQMAVQRYTQAMSLDQKGPDKKTEDIKNTLRFKLQEIIQAKTNEANEKKEMSSHKVREQQVIQRMRDMGADPSDQSLRQAFLFDACMQEGELSLKKQNYKNAQECFQEAIRLNSDDMGASLKEIWVNFLISDRDQKSYLRIKSQADILIKRFKDAPEPYLILAKIQRLYGDQKASEKNLRNILNTHPNHAEASAELRLLLNREFDKKKRKNYQNQADMEQRAMWMQALTASLLISVLFWGLGNFIPHKRDLWPEIKTLDIQQLEGNEFERKREFNQIIRTNYPDLSIANAANTLGLKPNIDIPNTTEVEEVSIKVRELTRGLSFLYNFYATNADLVLESLRGSRAIPEHLRQLGNVEHFWLSDDLFWWSRRLVLLLIGLIGLIKIKERDIGLVGSIGIAMIGIIYGSIVGFMSPVFMSPTPQGSLIGMKVLHVFAEQIFFIFFIGISLLKSFKGNFLITLPISIVLFACYKLSFFSIWHQNSTTMALSMLQIGVFIGGGCFALMWKSKGMLAPLLAHLMITFVPLLRGL
jgi:tetratricopeptide (TPR) repeat protein